MFFRALSVFAGGCTLDAAEEVCGADINTLQSLVEKSLLRFSNERYWMLETIRDYARERLDEAGETDALARRHADYHLALLEERQPHILGSRRRELLAWFGEEEDNLRATLDYLEDAAPQDAARAADLLTPFWLPRGRLVEGQERLLRLCPKRFRRGHARDAPRASLRHRAALGTVRQRRVSCARGCHARPGVGRAPNAHPRPPGGRCGRLLPGRLRRSGPCPDPRARRGRGGRRRVAEVVVLADLASFQIDAGRDEEARHMLQEASRGLRQTGDEANHASTSIYLAYLELYVRDFEAAYLVAASVLEKVREIGDGYRAIGASSALGFAALGLGRRSEAREAFAESLDLVFAADRTEGALTEALAGIALAADMTDPRSAAHSKAQSTSWTSALPAAHDSSS